jgi:hypothetical protein
MILAGQAIRYFGEDCIGYSPLAGVQEIEVRIWLDRRNGRGERRGRGGIQAQF